MTLADLTNGQEAIIIKVKGHGAFRRRILEMGFIKGKKVTVIKNAPLKDPIEYELLNYQVSLRRSEARLVEVVASATHCRQQIPNTTAPALPRKSWPRSSAKSASTST